MNANKSVPKLKQLQKVFSNTNIQMHLKFSLSNVRYVAAVTKLLSKQLPHETNSCDSRYSDGFICLEKNEVKNSYQ